MFQFKDIIHIVKKINKTERPAITAFLKSPSHKQLSAVDPSFPRDRINFR